MMKSFFIPLIILCLASSSCKKGDTNNYYTPGSPAPTQPPTGIPADTAAPRSYLALGDSYTIGQSVADTDRFPVQAAKRLTALGINFQNPEIIAQTGWTTGNLLSSLAAAAPSKATYNIVTLLIGVNNQYQHRTQQEYKTDFTTLLTMAIKYAGGNKKRVVVLSIPDYSVTPFANGSDRGAIAREIDAFNDINKTIATQEGVNYLDITGYTRLAANNASLVAIDGLHPSGMEYKVWVDSLVPIIKTAVQ